MMTNSDELLQFQHENKLFIPKNTNLFQRKWLQPKIIYSLKNQYNNQYPNGRWKINTNSVDQDSNGLTQHDLIYLQLSKHFEDIFVCESDNKEKYFYTVKASSSKNNDRKTGAILIYTGMNDKQQIIKRFRQFVYYPDDIKWQPNQNSEYAKFDEKGNLMCIDTDVFSTEKPQI